MRIMFVGGIQTKTATSRYYDFSQKIINGFTREGHHVIHFSDRDIARVQNIFRARKLGIKNCNKKFLTDVDTFRPHLIIFKHADAILDESITEIRRNHPEIKIAQLNIDALFNPDNIERIKKKSGLVDANFITTYGNALNKVKLNEKPIFYIPNPVDSSIENQKAFKETCTTDIFFSCGNTEPGDERYDIPHKLKKKRPEYKFTYSVAGQGTGLWGAKYIETLKECKIGLNLSRKKEKDRVGTPEDLYMYSSDRVAHYLGNGLLTFTDSEFHYDKLFTEDEMVFFNSPEDLMDKLDFYLKNDEERKRIAHNGWKAAHEKYNERQCAKFIIEATFGEIKSDFAWPTKPY